VKQPHTCGTSDAWHVHSQYTTKYLGRRIVSIIWADSDITVAALIEVIHGLTTYQFVMTKFGGLRSMPWHFCGEIGKKLTQKYRGY
jgi:hypothetical protein